MDDTGPAPAPAPSQHPFLTDTSFRDGQQAAAAPYTPRQVVRLYDLLHRLGGPRGVVRQAEFFLYEARDREAVEGCLQLGHTAPEVTAWIRADPRDLGLVRAAGLKETGILTSCSDYHIFWKLGWTREEAMRRYLEVAEAAVGAGIRIRCHLEDLTRADVHGFVVPLAIRLAELSRQSGVEIRLRLCDTLGLGLPFASAPLPRGVPRLVRALCDHAGFPGERLEWHGHNDFGLAVANAMAAWLHGCAAVNGTWLGFGERTGNVPIEAMAVAYCGLTGADDLDLAAATDAARFFETELRYAVPPMTPFVGAQMARTSAGIHADGIRKNEEVYSIFDTAALLGRPLEVAVTDRAGAAGVAFWLSRRLAREVDKKGPEVTALTEWVRQAFADGRREPLSDAELEAAAAQLGVLAGFR
ncbi:MAG TPA: 2-isopropylmalate synthase [Bacillota bacterium]|nr:2-isopropylmalate synthase [Bacillota bacterium]